MHRFYHTIDYHFVIKAYYNYDRGTVAKIWNQGCSFKCWCVV